MLINEYISKGQMDKEQIVVGIFHCQYSDEQWEILFFKKKSIIKVLIYKNLLKKSLKIQLTTSFQNQYFE